MNQHRYILEKGSKKHFCPECNKRRFVRYIDTETGQLLPEQYGRCDRESNCGYFLNPYIDGYSKMVWQNEKDDYSTNLKPCKTILKSKPKPKSVYIPSEVLKQTLSRYEHNIFLQNLLNRVKYPFEIADIEKVISLYYLGTVAEGYRTGAMTIPFIDIKGNIRTIQVKQFDETNHTTGTDFLHSIIEKECKRNNKALPSWLKDYMKQDKKVSCLFGEHLLSKYRSNPVALVEAPKTAIYATLYFGFPERAEDFIWLAVYNLSSLKLEKCLSLTGRNVFLFPDLSKDGRAFMQWSNKAKEIEKSLSNSRFIISDFLENNAGEIERLQGLDLADYLIQNDWREFRTSTNEAKNHGITYSLQPTNKQVIENAERSDVGAQQIRNNKENWNITELKDFFENKDITQEQVKLNNCSTIIDLNKFIKSHLTIVKAQNGKQVYYPYYQRLVQLREYLEILKN